MPEPERRPATLLSLDALDALVDEAWREAVRLFDAERVQLGYQPISGWPALTEYRNAETGRYYTPHHQAEIDWVLDLATPNLWALGGEGGGKTVAGVIRDLERARLGCTGVLTSPDFEHFKRSFWPELRRWIPWDLVVPSHRRMASRHWWPERPFQIVFETGGVFYLGGAKESEVDSWEGPNVNFWHADEIRRHRTPALVKVIDGRVRITGPTGVRPQTWYTTTPRKHWMYDFIGPISEDPEKAAQDPRLEYKRSSLVMRLFTRDNIANLSPGFLEKRRASLTEAEAEELLEAAWVDLEGTESFLPNMALWDRLAWPEMPPVQRTESLVLALDGAIGSFDEGSERVPDTFAISGVSRHPLRPGDPAIRFTFRWQPRPGYQLDFEGSDEMPGPMRQLRLLLDDPGLNIVQVCYDPYQMAYAAQLLAARGDVWLAAFSQQGERWEADKLFYDLVVQGRLAHNGDKHLREHVDNANRKRSTDGRGLRMIQREQVLKIDLAVASAMGCKRVLELNV